MVDRLSACRVLVNNSFITLNGAGAIAFAAAPTSFGGGPAVFFQAAITLACILLSVLWRETIVYYRHLSDAKFQVIHEMEELLPARPSTVEHEYFIGKRKAKLTPFTRGLSDMEIYIPVMAVIAAGSALTYTPLVLARPFYAMLLAPDIPPTGRSPALPKQLPTWCAVHRARQRNRPRALPSRSEAADRWQALPRSCRLGPGRRGAGASSLRSWRSPCGR